MPPVISAEQGCCWPPPPAQLGASTVQQPPCEATVCRLQSGARATQRVSGIRGQAHGPGKGGQGRAHGPPLIPHLPVAKPVPCSGPHLIHGPDLLLQDTRGLEWVLQSPGLSAQKLVPRGSSSRGRPGHSRMFSSLLFSSSVVLTRRAGWAALGPRPRTPASPRRRSLSPHASGTRPGMERYHHPQTLMGRTGSRARSWCWGWAWPCPTPPCRGWLGTGGSSGALPDVTIWRGAAAGQPSAERDPQCRVSLPLPCRQRPPGVSALSSERGAPDTPAPCCWEQHRCKYLQQAWQVLPGKRCHKITVNNYGNSSNSGCAAGIWKF